MESRWVLRNNTTHADAVYVIAVIEDGNSYTVEGRWGKWEQFMNNGKLGSKVYYSGAFLNQAKIAALDLSGNKLGRSYYRYQVYDTSMPWEWTAKVSDAMKKEQATPAPKPTPLRPTGSAAHQAHEGARKKQATTEPALTRQDIQTTRATVLEW